VHLPDGLLTLQLSASLYAASAVSLVAASRLARRSLPPERLPLLGVLGGFVFAAQLVNFPIAPGVSGHLTGGALLSIVLGPAPAILAMTSVVLVQCLMFADGGIVALGANVMNLAVVTPIAAHAVTRVLGDRLHGLAAAASVLAAALAVSLEVALSQAVPLGTFLLPMLARHGLIALAEGLATQGVVRALRAARPDLFGARLEVT
jgi:cobalt/nickel transport system permease protein